MARFVKMIMLAVLSGLPGVGPALAEQLTVPASDDTWIEDLNDNDTHGHELATAICPTANYWIYVKFDLDSVVGMLNSAEVRMTRLDGSRPDEISVYLITDDNWTENTLTGVTRPAPTNPPNTASLGVGEVQSGYDRWSSPSVTSTILSQAAGDGTLSLMFREDPAPMLDIRYYRSKEAPVPAGNKPHLVLDLSPTEVLNLHVRSASPTRLSWDAGSGSVHDVATGLLSDLRNEAGVDSATCLVNDSASISYDDTRPTPPLDDGYYYIARAQIGSETGPYGFASSGTQRTPLGACP